jgi:hypothetical protein
MGVRFISLADDDTVVAIARNAERAAVEDESDDPLGESEESEESVGTAVETTAEVTGADSGPENADGTPAE